MYYMLSMKFSLGETRKHGDIEGLLFNYQSADPNSRIVVDAPWISNRHFRIFSVIYTEETEPLLYVEDMSSQGNNTWMYKRDKSWEQIVMNKGNIMLFCHDDRLRLCDGTVFAFRSTHVNQSVSTPAGKDDLRDLEKEVSPIGSSK